MNAQLAYKNLNCQVTEVIDEDSKDEVMLQIIDVFLGITNYLVDKKYYSLKDDLHSEEEYNFITTHQSYTDDERAFIKSCYTNNGTSYTINFGNGSAKNDLLNDYYVRENQYTKGSVMKTKFLYQLMDTPEKLKKLQKICLFYWNGTENLSSMNLNEYIAEYYQFKTKYDDYNKNKMLKLYLTNNTATIDDYLKALGFSGNLDKLVRRYKRELSL